MATSEIDGRPVASYPYAPIQTAIAVAEAVKSLGGNKVPVSKSSLASALKEDEKSQGLTFKIGASKCFGLIEGRSSYTLTDTAKRYFYPASDADRVESAFSFLSSPSGFAAIIKRFDGSPLPQSEMLANLFHREFGVPESWKDRAASFFIRSAQFVGAMDDNGFLRVSAALHQAARERGAPIDLPPPSQQLPPPATDIQRQKFYGGGSPIPTTPEGYHIYELPLSNNRKVTISAPLDITQTEIKRLQRWAEFTLQVDWSDEKPTS